MDETRAGMTEISEHNFSHVASGGTSPEELVAFLQNGVLYRDFKTTLERLGLGEDLRARLTDGLAAVTGDDREAVARKVRNWLSGKNSPQNREQLFQIAFALELTEAQADRLLASAAECGIHYRDPKELVYAYALRAGKSYRGAQELLERAEEICRSAQTRAREGPEDIRFTRALRDEFSVVDSDQALWDFFREFGAELGQLHETAWREFMALYETLRLPSASFVLDDEARREMSSEPYSVDEVVDTYLRMRVPLDKRTADYTYLQKVLKKNWPNASGIQRMRARKQDVDRKTMVLLYLITEEFDWEGEEDIDLWEDEDADTRMETRLLRMDLFLERCGMNRLDPASPFDCLVIYAMRTMEGESAGEKFEQALHRLFPAAEEEKS